MSEFQTIRLLRSSESGKRPDPSEDLVHGQPAINYHPQTPGLFFSDANDDLVKVGPTSVGLLPPSANPCKGEQWLQIATPPANPTLWVYDGSDWRGVELNLTYPL